MIIGVAAPDFWWPSVETRLWVPLPVQAHAATEPSRSLWVMGRLRDGVDLAQANAELAATSQRLAVQYPDTERGWELSVLPPLEGLVDANNRLIRPLFFGLGACVLLLCCANVSNLLLVRAVGRRREMALRQALGAGSMRLVRQLLTEGLLLAIPAAVLALGVAYVAVKLVFAGLPGLPLAIPANPLDNTTAFLTVGTGMAAMVLASLMPLRHCVQPHLTGSLAGGARAGSSRGQRRLMVAVVALQGGLAACLLVTALFLAKGIRNETQLDPGFAMAPLVRGTVELPQTRYPADSQVLAYFEEVRRRVAGTPGVEAVGLISIVPQVEGNGIPTGYATDMSDAKPDSQLPGGQFLRADADALEALGVPVVHGRGIRPSDRLETQPIVLVNQTAAARLWPNRDAVGQRVRLTGPGNKWFVVVGVYRDVRRADPTQPVQPQFVVPLAQAPSRAMTILIRTHVEPTTVLAAARELLARFDPEQPVAWNTVTQIAETSRTGQRTLATLLLVMAGLALFVASAGLFSLLAYHLQQRRQEMAVRLALGAKPGDLQRHVARDAVKSLVPGVALGGLLSLFLTRQLAPLLYGMRAVDPITLVLSSITLAAAAGIAIAVPARRAARIEPAAALRQE